jgi:hypothetical protein
VPKAGPLHSPGNPDARRLHDSIDGARGAKGRLGLSTVERPLCAIRQMAARPAATMNLSRRTPQFQCPTRQVPRDFRPTRVTTSLKVDP